MDATLKETVKAVQVGTTGAEVRLSGRVVLVARVIWLAFALFNLVLSIINLLKPAFGGKTHICPLTFTCPPTDETLQVLKQAQIPLASYDTYVLIFGLAFGLIFLAISALLFWRKFDQPVGLLASFAFLFIGSNSLVGDFSTMPLVIQVFTAVVETNCQTLCLGFFLVTFPDGRFVPRWSWLIGCTLLVLAIFFQLPDSLNILSWPLPLIELTLVLAYGSPIVLQIYRYRRVSSPAQRQQTKWVIFGLASALPLLFLAFFGGALFPPLSLYQLAGEPLSSVAFLLIPISISIAILRSRLWDIDVIINRALVYGLLTATLLIVYLVLVFVGQALLSSLLGPDNALVLVGSTLIVAALFQPLRHHTQQFIDRSFYRRKYNAQQTLNSFSSTLRQAVDLDQVREQLLVAVQETMQPASLSLWLRSPGKRQGRGTSGESLSRGGE
jgi:hypothetical protein